MTTQPAVCELCSYPVYEAAAHPCCVFWRAILETGKACPACASSRASKQRGWQSAAAGRETREASQRW